MGNHTEMSEGPYSSGQENNLNLLAHRVAALIADCEVIESSVTQPVVQLENHKAAAEIHWHPVPSEERLLQVYHKYDYS